MDKEELKKLDKQLKEVLRKIGGDPWFLVRWSKERKPLLKFIVKLIEETPTPPKPI